MTEDSRYDGLLTDEIVRRAMRQLSALNEDVSNPGPYHKKKWLSSWEARLDDVVEDVTVIRNRFRKAQTGHFCRRTSSGSAAMKGSRTTSTTTAPSSAACARARTRTICGRARICAGSRTSLCSSLTAP